MMLCAAALMRTIDSGDKLVDAGSISGVPLFVATHQDM
jgi:hypothetical protein